MIKYLTHMTLLLLLLHGCWLACSNTPQSAAPAPEPLTAAADTPTPVAAPPVPEAPVPAAPPVSASNKKKLAAAPVLPAAPVAQSSAPGSPSAPAPEPAPGISPAPELHAGWDALLRRLVDSKGRVNYAGFKNAQPELDRYLQTLADNPPKDTWSRDEQMAYWINAYNAFTIDLIVDNYPVSSILKLDNGKTWDVQRIALGGKKYSLNQIENEILRPKFKDARIHFAINCAAKSCPPLYNRAFTAANLQGALEQRTRQFVNNPAYNSIAADGAAVSKIFEWYAVDFGDLREYLNRFSETQLKIEAAIRFQEYDWALNM